MSMQRDFKDVKSAVTSALVETTKVAGQISNEDLAFHRSSNPSIIPLLDKQNARLLKTARRLAKIATLGTELSAPQLRDVESLDDNWRSVVDVFDNLLEKADACLDEFTGSIKRLSPGQEEQIRKAVPAEGRQKPGKAYRNQNIPKPQLLFNNIPTNEERSPFKPLLRSKPHAIVPLEDSLSPEDSQEAGPKQYRHPYETEIQASRYPSSTYVKSDPIPYLPYHETKAALVDTPEAVTVMLDELKQTKEVAIDLEHHDEHSYIGLVSLMQISTRQKDWVVDTLKPWRQDLQVLNEVFVDPNILKVFHGAFMDMIWLQRDLGLYVVGLFDTFHASRALGYPRNSLAYLLKHFADFDAAKQYQMADWRIRPLPEKMFDYARSDTHFLLYIYDNLRNELIDKSSLSQTSEDLIETVLNNSKEEALQRYERPFYDYQRGSGPMGWYSMLCRTPTLFNREQFAVFRAVHQWRDDIARLEDESLHSVMPKHVLYNIARDIPTDMPSLLGCSHPMSKPFSNRRDDLLGVIRRAKVNGVNGPDMKELMQEIDPLQWQKVRAQGSAPRLPVEDANAGVRPSQPVKLSHTTLPLRCEESQFWGSSLLGTGSMGYTDKAQVFSLALPLPQLTAEVFEDANPSIQSTPQGAMVSPKAPTAPNHVTNGPSKKDEIFIIKQGAGSGKRKASLYSEGTEQFPPEEEDNETGNGEGMENSLDQYSVMEHRHERAEKQAEKKRLKREKRREKERANNVNAGNGVGAPAAFDYANAPSVLHAKQSLADRVAAASKGVNPYAKSMDAPKGMRKSKKEIPGRSHTFKK